MKNGKLGVAVIGVGFFGQTHARTYASLPGVDLVAVADVDEARVRATADEHGVAGYTDIDELLARDDIDMVSVVTPEPLHREPVLRCAEAGKHVFVEKPIATTLEDAEAIIAAAKNAGVKLTVGFESRFALGYSQVKEALDGGSMGELSYVYAKRRSDIGFADIKQGRVSPIFEIAIHDIDLFLWYSGFEEITEVYCCGVNRVVAEKWGQPDWMTLSLRTRSGAMALLDFGWALPRKWAGWSKPDAWHPYADVRMEAIGTKGAVYADMHPMMVRACDDSEGWKFPDLVYWPNIQGVVSGAIRAELEAFVRCCGDDTEPVVTGEEAIQSLRVALMAEESYRLGEPVRLPSVAA